MSYVRTSMIHNGAVTAAKLAAGAVAAAALAALSVTTAKIADLAVTTAKINDLAVTTGKLAANAVDSTKLASASVTPTKVATAPSAVPAGAIPVGGGAIMYELVLAVSDVATGNVDFTGCPFKFQVTEVLCVKTGGAGDAGNSWTVHNGTGGNAITNGLNAVADQASTSTSAGGSVNDAFSTIAAGATIRVAVVRAAGDSSGLLVLRGHIVP